MVNSGKKGRKIFNQAIDTDALQLKKSSGNASYATGKKSETTNSGPRSFLNIMMKNQKVVFFSYYS